MHIVANFESNKLKVHDVLWLYSDIKIIIYTNIDGLIQQNMLIVHRRADRF